MSTIKEELKDYINWAIAITFLVSALLFSREKLLALFSENSTRSLLSAALLLTTVVWFFLYLRAVRHELELLDSSFDSDRIRKVAGLVLPTGVALSVFFGSLIALCDDIVWYAGLAALLSAFDLYGQATTIRNVWLFISAKKFRGPIGENESKMLSAYYLEKPLLTRIAIVLVTLCGSFVLASYSRFHNAPSLEYVAYCAVITVVLGSEVVIERWRRERDTALAELHDNKSQDSARYERHDA